MSGVLIASQGWRCSSKGCSDHRVPLDVTANPSRLLKGIAVFQKNSNHKQLKAAMGGDKSAGMSSEFEQCTAKAHTSARSE